MTETNTWVFNMVPENWDDCVQGPTNEQIHGDNTGEPWQGVGVSSPSQPEELHEGDLVFARVKGEGIAGVWTYHDRRKVHAQSEVPWEDNEYEWVIYCRPLHRELDDFYKEDFLTGPEFGAIGTALANLSPDYKQRYLEHILTDVALTAAARDRLERELGRSVGGEPVNETVHAADVAPTNRVQTELLRPIRNTELVEELKDCYDYTCQVCGDRRERGDGEPYAEGHHLHPLGEDGPDTQANILILCPNHHADFDYGAIHIDPDTHTITHQYDSEVDGRPLLVAPNHPLQDQYLEYHNHKIATI